MALTEIYVDPSIAGDSGTGTIGDPFGDFQYALTNSVFDTTNGTRINVKAGTDEVLTANGDFTTNFFAGGGTSATAHLVIEGYTSTAGDGGEGGISGDGSFQIISNTSRDYVTFRNMHLHNCATAIVQLDDFCTFDTCRFDTCSTLGVRVDNYCQFVNCSFTEIGGTVIEMEVQSVVENCYFKNGTTKPTHTVFMNNASVVRNSIFSLDGSSSGVTVSQVGCRVEGNTFYGAGTATGSAVLFDAATHEGCSVTNNIISGFNGTGGDGVDFGSSTVPLLRYQNNTFYNNASNESNVGSAKILNDEGNETASAEPVALSGSDTFANRFTYFAPVDTDSIHGGSYPDGTLRDRGAVQHTDPAGGGGGIMTQEFQEMDIKPGATNQTIDVFIRDSSSTTGGGLTGLAYNSAGLTCYYRRGATGSMTALSLATLAAVSTAHADGGFKEIDATNAPGMYRLDLSDAVVAAGVPFATVYLRGATNMAPTAVRISLEEKEADVVKWLGTAAATPTNAGVPEVDVTHWLGSAADDLLDAEDINAQVLDVIDTDTFAELAAVPAANAPLSDKINWLFMLARNRVTQSATTQTVYADDGTTTVSTSAVSTSAGTTTRAEFA